MKIIKTEKFAKKKEKEDRKDMESLNKEWALVIQNIRMPEVVFNPHP